MMDTETAAAGNTMNTASIIRKSMGDVPIVAVIRRMRAAARDSWTARRDRPLLAFIAAPLAMTATALLGLWWAWPVLLGCGWAWTKAWRWSWLLTLQLAIVSAEWAYVGANSIGKGADRAIAGVLWAAFPLGLAGAGLINRRYHDVAQYDIEL